MHSVGERYVEPVKRERDGRNADVDEPRFGA
jgi:hypothetical protein